MNQPTHADDQADGRALRRPLGELSAIEAASAFSERGDPAARSRSGERPQGPEFRVETMTSNGMHQVVGIAHSCDAPPAEPEQATLRSAVMALLDLAGHESGPARTTVVLTARGPHIVGCELQGS
ncbi:hypothetical protein [Streptomyces sp. NRRL WC-3618]|uniref:hypothetical protein n=1 Tax=Streptomyces sp. NRRL WC-3618 TaxID=1519490 RepID=UPI0006B01EE9|nr:hypothetical protein [Streptomyces sp. NRRL WC-3618]